MIFLAAFLLIGVSCSPTKKAARQEDNLQALKDKLAADKSKDDAKTIADYVAANPCVFPEYNFDSLCELYCQNPNTKLEVAQRAYDTLYKHDTSYIKGKVLNNRVLVPVPDLRAQKLMTDTILSLRNQLIAFTSKARGKQEVLQTIKSDKWSVKNWWFLIALGLFTLHILRFKFKK